MNSRILLGLVAATVVGFGMGWLVHSSLAPGESESDGNLSSVPQRSSLVPGPTRTAEELKAERAEAEARREADPTFVGKYLKNGVLDGEGMKKAMAELLSESDPIETNRKLAELLAKLTPENAEVAMKAVQAMGSRDPGQFFMVSLLANAWGQLDGEKALAYTSSQSNRQMSRAGAASALAGWAMESPEEAIAWLDAQEDGNQKTIYNMRLFRGLATGDPDRATDYLVNKVDATDPMKPRYLDQIASEQWKRGPDTATAWAEALEDESLRGAAFEDLANRYTQEDPARAADWITARVDEPWAGDAVKEIADEWAEKDPAAAVEWAKTLPEEAQGGAMSAAFAEWTQADPVTASELLAGMEDSAVKDHAIAGFADQFSREDPAAAVTWAETIQNPQVRQDALTQAGQRWMRQDQEAAAAWLQASGLPEDVQVEISQPPAREFNFDDMRARFLGGD